MHESSRFEDQKEIINWALGGHAHSMQAISDGVVIVYLFIVYAWEMQRMVARGRGFSFH